MGKASCLVRWRSGAAKAIRLGTVLCDVLFFVCVTLVISLVVWSSVSDSLSHLADEYRAMRHVNNIGR